MSRRSTGRALGLGLIAPHIPLPLIVVPTTVTILTLQVWGSYVLAAISLRLTRAAA